MQLKDFWVGLVIVHKKKPELGQGIVLKSQVLRLPRAVQVRWASGLEGWYAPSELKKAVNSEDT